MSRDILWQTREFKTWMEVERFIDKIRSRYQWEVVFVNNGICVEYRKLRKVY